MANKQSDVLEPRFDGGLIRNKYIKAGLFVVKTKAQRNTEIKTLYRELDGSTTTLCYVSADRIMYELSANPSTEGTTDGDWTAIDFGVSDILIAQGLWDKDNTDPVLQDTGAVGNGNDFYVVTDAPTPVAVQHAGLFGGALVTVKDGDWVISNGAEWFVSAAPIDWDSISNKPSVITEYVAGDVIAHNQAISTITDLQAALDLKYDLGDVGDHGIAWASVPDAKLVDAFLLKTNYYERSVLYTKTEIDALLQTATLTTKGDLLGHNGVITARVGVGGDGLVLVADSVSAEGFKWAAVSGGIPAWALGGSSILSYAATGASSFSAVDGITNQLDLSGQDTAEIYDFISQDILTTGRTSTGEANFLRFQNNSADVFKVDSIGVTTIGSKVNPDPSGANGMFYYNSTNDKFRVYENGAWVDMIGGASGAWTTTSSSILNYSPTGAASFSAVDGVTNPIDITGQTGTQTYDFITQNLLDTARVSTGEANFFRFQNDGVDVFKVDSVGKATISGVIDLGTTAIAGADRTIQSVGSATDVGLKLFTQGAGSLITLGINGGTNFRITANDFYSSFTSGGGIRNASGSEFIPTLLPRRDTIGLGIGHKATDQLSFITGNNSRMSIDNTNIVVGGVGVASYGTSALRVMYFYDAAVPSTDPTTGGGVLFSDTGVLKWRSDITGEIDLTSGGGGAFTADVDTQITPSTPILLDHATNNELAFNLSGTVNKAAGNASWIFANVTDTASPSTFNLMDLQVGAVSKFQVDADGGSSYLFRSADIQINSSHLLLNEIAAPTTDSAGYGRLYANSADSLLYWRDDSGTVYDLTSGGGWSLTATTTLNYTATGAANFIGVDGITNQHDASAQDTAETYDFITHNLLTTGRTSTGEAHFLRYQENAANVFSVDTTGNVRMGAVAATGYKFWDVAWRVYDGLTGAIMIRNNTSFASIQHLCNAYFLSGYKRKSANPATRIYQWDDVIQISEAPTGAINSAITWTESVLINSTDIVMYDDAGAMFMQWERDTKSIIMGASGTKIGFFNVTPVIRQTTTSQTPATFTANSSGIVDDTATWNGYTIGDLVAILQAYGLLT